MQNTVIYTHGCETALRALGINKVAFIGAVTRGLQGAARALRGSSTGKAVGTAGKMLGGQLAPSSIAKKMAPLGAKIENQLTRAGTRVLGPSGGDLTKQLVSGLPAEMARQTVGGAAIGGVLEGGIRGLAAEDGQGWGEFRRGLGSGALSGAAYGAIGGAVTAPAKNMRQLAMTQRAKGLGSATPSLDAAMQINRGFFGNVKDTFTGKGLMGRGGSAEAALGGAGQFAAENIIPLTVMPAALSGSLGPQPESQPYKAASQAEDTLPKIPPTLLASIAGGTGGGLSAGVLVDSLRSKNRFPTGAKGTLLGRAVPAVGSLSGSLLGYNLGRKALTTAESVDDIEDKLNQLDFDKLMRYYKKREALGS